MTDIASYLNLLFATIGQPHCPRTGEPTPSRSASQILEAILSLPRRRRDRAARAGLQDLRRGARLRLHRSAEEGLPPADRRRQAGRHLPTQVELDEARASSDMDAVVDRFVVGRKHEKAIKAGIAGDAARRRRAAAGARRQGREQGRGRAVLRRRCAAPTHHFVYGDIGPELLRVQQSRERVPHVRRPRRGQAHASRAADSRSAAQHPRRLLRARRRSSTTRTRGTAG